MTQKQWKKKGVFNDETKNELNQFSGNYNGKGLQLARNLKIESDQPKKNFPIKSFIQQEDDQIKPEPGYSKLYQALSEKSSFQYNRYYFKNEFFKEQFDLRFDQIKNSLVDQNIFSSSISFALGTLNEKKQRVPKDQTKLNNQLPIRTPNFIMQKNKITYTWLGHSTAIISFGNHCNFMIDPVFSDRCSPSQFVGPKRYRKVPCEISKLPRIDVVLISHDHYDHLDFDCLQKLYQRNRDTVFIAGLNSEDVLPKGCQKKTMNWTEQYDLNINGYKFEITFVPACHWSRRSYNDRNYRLWGGFVIKSPNGKKVFYSGDTGYCQVFKEIGENFQGFDLSILPIGAYQPRKLLRNQHVNPEQAVQIHLDIKSKKSVGVHWGTFPLGYQHYLAPRQDLQKAIEGKNLTKQSFITIDHGGRFQIDYC